MNHVFLARMVALDGLPFIFRNPVLDLVPRPAIIGRDGRMSFFQRPML